MGWGRRGAGRPGLGGGPACGAPGARQGEPTGPPPRARGPGRCPRRRPRPARRAGSARWQKGLLGNVVPRARQSGASVRRLRGRQRAGEGLPPRRRRSCEGAPSLAPKSEQLPRAVGGGATYLSAEELPDQGGGHLLHEEAVHAAASAHEAAAAQPGAPGSVGQYGRVAVTTVAAPGETPPLPGEPAGAKGRSVL